MYFRLLVAGFPCRRHGSSTRVVDVGLVICFEAFIFASHYYFAKVSYSSATDIRPVDASVPGFSVPPRPSPTPAPGPLQPIAYKGPLLIFVRINSFAHAFLSESMRWATSSSRGILQSVRRCVRVCVCVCVIECDQVLQQTYTPTMSRCIGQIKK
jgi:hypothetical protein